MSPEQTISYPRRRFGRAIVRGLGRILLTLFFRVRLDGEENFPDGGPLLVVGNHTAAMEAVMMAVYTPWQVEMLGAGDIPQETITELVEAIYDYIPVNRGNIDRAALRKALQVLEQDGILAVFPEGGIWEPGPKPPQTGVSWFSYRTQTPVLPIYFGGTTGALNDALRLKRPRLTMRVGTLIPPASIPEGIARKSYFEQYAEKVMDAVHALRPADEPVPYARVKDETFSLEVSAQKDGAIRAIPDDQRIEHREALAKFLHRPAILKIFTKNLQLPVQPLENLAEEPSPAHIDGAVRAILNYLEEENPYLLSYRFGPKQAEAMEEGLRELKELVQWAKRTDVTLRITPIREYFDLDTQNHVTQRTQGDFIRWM